MVWQVGAQLQRRRCATIIARNHFGENWEQCTEFASKARDSSSPAAHFEGVVDAVVSGDGPRSKHALREYPELVRARSCTHASFDAAALRRRQRRRRLAHPSKSRGSTAAAINVLLAHDALGGGNWGGIVNSCLI